MIYIKIMYYNCTKEISVCFSNMYKNRNCAQKTMEDNSYFQHGNVYVYYCSIILFEGFVVVQIFTVFKSYDQVALLVVLDNCIRGGVEFGHVVK